MRKFTSVLSLTAIVLSALFMSCAKSKTPDVVVAFPSNKYASYERDENYESNAEGAYKWVVEKKYTYDPYALNNPLSSSGGIYGGFDLSSVLSPRTINYWFEPNLDWTVEVMGIGKKYIVLGYGHGYKSENYVTGDVISGGYGKGFEDLQIEVVRTPEYAEGDQECVIELEMNGQRMPIATILIQSAYPVLSVPTLPKEGLALGNVAGTYDLEFNVAHPIKNAVPSVTVSGGAGWLDVTEPDNGKITLTYAQNVEPTPREATISLHYQEAKSLDIVVKQAGDIWLNITDGIPTENLSHAAGAFSLSFDRKVADDTTPIVVEINEEAQSWLHVGDIDYDSCVIPFTYDANTDAPGSAPRKATISISFEGIQPQTVNIKQNAEALPETPENPGGEGGNTEGGNTEGGNTEGGNTEGGNTEGGNTGNE